MDEIHLSPSPVHVGNEASVSLTLASGTAPDLTAKFRESPSSLLEAKRSDALSATFLAKNPGQTRILVTLLDRKTLLSPALGVPVEVVPRGLTMPYASEFEASSRSLAVPRRIFPAASLLRQDASTRTSPLGSVA